MIFLTLPTSTENINNEFQSWIFKLYMYLSTEALQIKAPISTLVTSQAKKSIVGNSEIISSHRTLKHIISIHLKYRIYHLTWPSIESRWYMLSLSFSDLGAKEFGKFSDVRQGTVLPT